MDIENACRVFSFKTDAPPLGSMWSSDGKKLCSWTANSICVLSMDDGRDVFFTGGKSVSQCAFSRDGKYLSSIEESGATYIHNLETAEQVRLNVSAKELKWSPLLPLLMVNSKSAVSLFTGSGALVEVIEQIDEFRCIAWHQVERDFYAAATAAKLYIWKIGETEALCSFPCKEEPEKICFSNCSSLAYRSKKSVFIWGIRTGTDFKLPGSDSQISDLDWSFDGKWLAFAQKEQPFLWSVDPYGNGLLLKLAGEFQDLKILRFHPFQNLLVAVGGDGVLNIWQPDSPLKGRPISILKLEESLVEASWHPSERKLALAINSGRVDIWDIQSIDSKEINKRAHSTIV